VTRVAFYISGHGFGHASRQVEVINALGALAPRLAAAGVDPRVLIRSSVSPALLARTLRVPYDLQPLECDTGIVQTNSVTHDDPRTIRDTAAFYATFDERVSAEADVARSNNVGLIVGDVPPLAFAVADRMGVPSIAIANFLWDWIYEGYAELLASAPYVVPAIRAAYGHTTIGLRLPFSHDFDAMPRTRDIPLIARHGTLSRDETRVRLGLPLDRPIALLSFGGYGLPDLDVFGIDCLKEWSLAVTDRSLNQGTRALPASVHQIGEGAFGDGTVRYEDVIGAVDVVVTKPGYGIVAECIAAGTPLVYTSRGKFLEYDVFVEEMPRYLRCQFISQADLFGGRWRAALDAVMQQGPPPLTMTTNGADIAAAAILAQLEGDGSC
jgi:L-arabinokinase